MQSMSLNQDRETDKDFIDLHQGSDKSQKALLDKMFTSLHVFTLLSVEFLKPILC